MTATAVTAFASVGISVPPKLRARIHAVAEQNGHSIHNVIVEAVERHADYEVKMRGLVKEALEADAGFERSGEAYRTDDVHAWMGRLARDAVTDRPKSGRR